jgi:hypothetical protein
VKLITILFIRQEVLQRLFWPQILAEAGHAGDFLKTGRPAPRFSAEWGRNSRVDRQGSGGSTPFPQANSQTFLSESGARDRADRGSMRPIRPQVASRPMIRPPRQGRQSCLLSLTGRHEGRQDCPPHLGGGALRRLGPGRVREELSLNLNAGMPPFCPKGDAGVMVFGEPSPGRMLLAELRADSSAGQRNPPLRGANSRQGKSPILTCQREKKMFARETL